MKLDLSHIEVMDERMANILRHMTIQERVRVANRMFVSTRNAIIDRLRKQHPDWTEEQTSKETAREISQLGGDS